MYFTPKRLKLYLGGLFIVQIATCIGLLPLILRGVIDYRSYYIAGYMLRTGNAHLLYDYPTVQRIQSAVVSPASAALPFFSPPFATLPFVPLSFLHYLPSFLVFSIINLALLGLTIRIMLPYLHELSARWRPLPALLFLTFLSVANTLAMGQLSILLLLLYCLAFVSLHRGHDLTAGIIVSLALIKFQYAVPVALLFLCWRRWRFFSGFLLGSAFLAVLSIIIFAPLNFAHYLHFLGRTSALAGTPLQSVVGIEPRSMACFYGLFFCLAPTNHVATMLDIIASLALFGWAISRRPSLPLALLVAMLVSYHLYACDLTLLLLPLSLLCDRLFAPDTEPKGPPETASSTPRLSRLHWLPKFPHQLLLCSMGTFLIGPALAVIIADNLVFLLALPLLGLTLTYPWWPILHGAPAPEPLPEPALELPVTT